MGDRHAEQQARHAVVDPGHRRLVVVADTPARDDVPHPSSSFARNRGMSRGECCRSASKRMMQRRSVAFTPVTIASVLPRLRRWLTTRNPFQSAASRRATSAVPSVEPSSTSTTSPSRSNSREGLPQFAHQVGDHGGLVEGGDDDREVPSGLLDLRFQILPLSEDGGPVGAAPWASAVKMISQDRVRHSPHPRSATGAGRERPAERETAGSRRGPPWASGSTLAVGWRIARFVPATPVVAPFPGLFQEQNPNGRPPVFPSRPRTSIPHPRLSCPWPEPSESLRPSTNPSSTTRPVIARGRRSRASWPRCRVRRSRSR